MIKGGHHKDNKLQNRIYKEWLICTVVLCTITFAISFWSKPLGLHNINNFLYDSSMHIWPDKHIDTDIVIIGIDDKSIEELGHWPWSRSIHADLLEKLKDARVVIFDILFSEPSENSNQTYDQDKIFAQAIANHSNVLLPEALDSPGNNLLKPIRILEENAKGIGRIDVELDDDGVLRHVDLWRDYQNPYTNQPEKIPHISVLANDPQHYTKSSYENNIEPNVKISFIGTPENYEIYSYTDVLNDRVTSKTFQGKMVIIGVWATGIGDKFTTPIKNKLMSGSEVLANVLQNMHHNTWIHEPRKTLIALFNLIPVLIICLLVRKSSIKLSLLQPLLAIIISLALDIISMHTLDYWIPPAGLILTLIITYPLWSWRSQEVSLKYIDEQLLDLSTKGFNVNNAERYDTLPTRVYRLINAVDLMDQSIKERNEAFYFLSHDMRAPQSSILSSLELRKINPNKYNEALTNKVIKKQANITLNLIEQFLNLTQARHNELNLEKIPISLIIDNCINDMELIADKHSITINKNLAENSNGMVNIDYSLISRAIRNLLFNAIYYSHKNSSINIALTTLPNFYAIDIQNYGPIIPKDEMGLIFQSFHRGKDGKSMDQSGMGLGLAMVLVTIQRHKGEISCKSDHENGTVFTIKIPKANN